MWLEIKKNKKCEYKRARGEERYGMNRYKLLYKK